MKKKRHKPEQIIAKLREADAMLGAVHHLTQGERLLEHRKRTTENFSTMPIRRD